MPAGTGGQAEAAADLATDLAGRGVRVLLDDRPGVSAGVRFTDAELLGAPLTVVVGRRFPDGYVEVRDRAAGTRSEVAAAQVGDLLMVD